jgi:hypothetical protein
MAIGRRTPVAFSDISSIKIKEELASRDLPMILNTTPGVYATQSGGGDGDARVNIRGFNQRNVSVMVDGIPMNDMENGWVYWSNWFGLDNVTQKTQVQRGLGASKLAVPSIGGNINILTQGMDEKFNIKLSSEMGNNNMMRQGIGINSGRLKGNWGITAAFSYRTNDGWVEQLNSEQMFYFLKVQKTRVFNICNGKPTRTRATSWKKSIIVLRRGLCFKTRGRYSGIICTKSSIGPRSAFQLGVGISIAKSL